MVQTNTNLRVYYHTEANYGCGFTGAVLRAATADLDGDGYAILNYLAGDVKIGGIKYKRSRLKAPGIGLGKGLMVTTGADFPDVEFSYYTQGIGADPFGALAVAGTEGTTGTSYTFNVIVPDPTAATGNVAFTVYGAQLKSYKIDGSMDNDKPPKVTITWTCFDVIEEGDAVVDDVNIPVPTTAVQEWEDSICTIDGDIITELKSFDFAIENEYVEVGSGKNASYDRFAPLLKDKMLTYKVEFFLDAAAILNDMMLATLNEDTTVIYNNGADAFTVTNCWMSENNFPEYTGDDIAEAVYSVTFKNGNSVFSVA